MYTRDNLPPTVALVVAAYGVERDNLSDRFIQICNQSRIDGLGIYEELRSLAHKGLCDADVVEPEHQLIIMSQINVS